MKLNRNLAYKSGFLGIILVFLFTASFGQDSTVVAGKKEKNFRFLPLPAFAVSPTTGWMLGVAPGACLLDDG